MVSLNQVTTMSGPMPVFVNNDYDQGAVGKAMFRTDENGKASVVVEMTAESAGALMSMMAGGYQVVGLSFIYIKKGI